MSKHVEQIDNISTVVEIQSKTSQNALHQKYHNRNEKCFWWVHEYLWHSQEKKNQWAWRWDYKNPQTEIQREKRIKMEKHNTQKLREMSKCITYILGITEENIEQME